MTWVRVLAAGEVAPEDLEAFAIDDEDDSDAPTVQDRIAVSWTAPTEKGASPRSRNHPPRR